MRLKDTKTVKAMVDRMNAQAGTSDYEDLTNKPTINGVEVTGALTSADLDIATAQEDIILAGDATWLSGNTIIFEDAEDIAKLEHFKELVLAGKRPRFGFTQNYMGADTTVVKEPDSWYVIDALDTFSSHFSVYLGSYTGFFGVVVVYEPSNNPDYPWYLIANKIPAEQ